MTLLAEGLPWIEALGWTLLHFLWQGTIVGVAFALLRASIPRHHCNARYANGLMALASMAILPVATFFTLLPSQTAHVQVSPTRAAMPFAVSDAVDSMAATSVDAALPWIVGVWLIGVAIVGLHSWRQWHTLAQVARRWAEPDTELQQIVAALARRFDFVRQIRVLVSDRIDTPTLIGWLKPVILLPTAVAIGFPRQQIELILAHELGHLRRYDHLVNLAQAILETLLFYHPVVHWIAREVRNEREICCDTLVLRVTAGEPREYAQTLAALEELRQPPIRLALAANGGVLLERVRRILFAPHPVATRVGRRMWLPAILTVVVAATVAVGLNRPDTVQFDGPPLMTDSPAQPAMWAGWSAHAQNIRLTPPKFTLAAPSIVDPVSTSSTPIESAVAPSLTAVAQAPAPPPPIAGSDSASRFAVADIVAAKPVMPVVDAPSPSRIESPVATRKSAPKYPSSARTGRRVLVELQFAVESNGKVGNIGVVSEPADPAFERAAREALEQWRFDPSTVVADGTARYSQAFVFAPQGIADANQEANGCVRRTGSLLCMRGESSDAAAADVDGNSQMASTQRSARSQTNVEVGANRGTTLAYDQDTGSAP